MYIDPLNVVHGHLSTTLCYYDAHWQDIFTQLTVLSTRGYDTICQLWWVHYTAHPNTSNRCVQGHRGPGTSPTQYVPTCTTPPFYCILLCSSLWPLNLYALWYVVFFNTLVWICAVVKYLICGYIFSYLCRSTFMFNMKAQIKGEGIRLEDMTSLIPVPSTLPTGRPHPHPSFWWGPWWAGAGAWISSEAPGLSQTPSFSLDFVKGCPIDQRTRTIDVLLSITRQFVQATPTIVTAPYKYVSCMRMHNTIIMHMQLIMYRCVLKHNIIINFTSKFRADLP